MTALESSLRNLLEKAVTAAREAAEAGATDALGRLAVNEDQPYDTMSADERELRRRLRAKSRQLGGYEDLIAECAYEHWHRMLFARFLAENDLLMHSSGVPVTLDECEELAADDDAYDGWELAARFASQMLPQIFRTDDPVLEVRLAPEHQQRLEGILDDVPAKVFDAEDSLGWVYQYWQSDEKDRVNASEEKISGKNIGPVTQLFTEPYMVQFLLHNTLGAWWIDRHPDEPLPVEMPYLRTLDDGTPAAGSFDGWPDTAAEITIMDPCCGSGHFLVTAFDIMQRFRMAEEDLSEVEAGEAVLEENLFGLEIDQRCTQIAAFALAFVAWRRGGYRQLPQVNVACSGQALHGTREDWVALANGDERLRGGMGQLHELFQQAPDLGSLIDPERELGHGNILSAGFEELQPLLENALRRETAQRDDNVHFAAVAAQGVARAAKFLAGRYNLVTTNVPYLLRRKQASALQDFIKAHHPEAKNDLATAFIERCVSLCSSEGIAAMVTPMNWLFLGSYKKMRETLLKRKRWHLLARVGKGAFREISGEIVNVVLLVIGNGAPTEESCISCLETQETRNADEKARLLQEEPVSSVTQTSQLRNPDARVVGEEIDPASLLSQYANSTLGFQTADYPRFGRYHWELPLPFPQWRIQQSSVSETQWYDGCDSIVRWETAKKAMADRSGAAFRGERVWGQAGVIVSLMSLKVALYTGVPFDVSTGVITPEDPSHLPALWAFCSSPDFEDAIRQIDQSLYVTVGTVVKIPFDLEHWQNVAEEQGPLPEPYSEDPTQWLFDGNPVCTTNPLQVAVARLLGYQWPEREGDGLDEFADDDGIVCLPSISGEKSAADRLQDLLEAAFGEEWSRVILAQLLADVGYEGETLDDWLRNGFFEQHYGLFENRPFIWHIWDGRRDGFAALVNYHKLDRNLLSRLIYTRLRDWVRLQQRADEQGVEAANARLVAAERLQEKLELILEGEEPYDIFVRWKPLHEQPIGWEPDLNDGVRLNIRPFMEAGVLRSKPNIKWTNDRGKNPPGSPWGEKRVNDRHRTLAEKKEARENAE